VVQCINEVKLNAKGYSRYWRDIIRPDVLKRDNYSCKHCGQKQHSLYVREGSKRTFIDDDFLRRYYLNLGFKISTIHLSIAHTCHNKCCINPAHLLSLCQACHLVFDKHHHVVSRLINAANKAKSNENKV